MSVGVFVDKACEPSQDEILRFLDSKGGLWVELLACISENYQVDGEFKYYGKKTGWAFRIRKAGKALLMLFFEDDGLKAQVVLNPEQTVKALGSNLSPMTKEMLKEAKVYHDGRWLLINLKFKRDLDDICKLLAAKRKPSGK